MALPPPSTGTSTTAGGLSPAYRGTALCNEALSDLAAPSGLTGHFQGFPAVHLPMLTRVYYRASGVLVYPLVHCHP
jgi:hypothetical protein